uniref:glycoside hydrolase family 13 protein n=1 Tax=Thaumasiovibrio occultus TaxID=1891184 RepID=UPI000B35B09E|nr:glycoside hydrolase family 13 protein [Thaumasiovibrio occultus]
MITRSALQHVPKSAQCYAYDNTTLHVRMQSARGEIERVTLWIGDPYRWAEGGLDGGNLGGADAHGWVGGEEVEMALEATTELHDHWFAAYQPPKLRTRYGFILHGKDGSETILFGEKKCVELDVPEREKQGILSNISNFFCFPYINPADVLSTPAWVKDTVWYQIFPERFANGRPEISPEGVMPWGSTPTNDNFMGGDLWGVLDKLDYLQELGVNGLYFCPIFTAIANHKYDTTDYMNVDPQFGGNEAFKALVDECHRRGIKVMLDAVFNHVGDQHPFWLDVVEKGENSQYKDWFWINEFPVYPNKPRAEWDFWNLPYETFANVAEMPKLNTEHPECRAYLLSVARHWMEEFNIDGWRLDVANEVDHEFWREFRRQSKAINPECYILGEIWHEGMAWLRGDQYDSLMNYPMTQAVKDYFAFNNTDANEFVTDISRAYVSYPQNVNEAIFNLLDSHDTSRLLSEVQGNKEKAKLAYLFMFTQSGAPCIYYGGEVGMDGMKSMESEGNRKCMEWDESKQDRELYAFMQSMIQLRRDHDDFKTGTIAWHKVTGRNAVAYQKGQVVVIINNSDADDLITLPTSLAGKHVSDLLRFSDETLAETMTIPAYGYRIVKLHA